MRDRLAVLTDIVDMEIELQDLLDRGDIDGASEAAMKVAALKSEHLQMRYESGE